MEVALAATENACCTVAMREAAHQAAHKLAGSLGMFGLARGTEIARALEEFFAAEAGCGTAENLREWTAELRRIIDK